MNRNIERCAFGRFFFAAFVVIVAGSHRLEGSDFYLALVGPPPLRIESVATNDAGFMRELELPKPASTRISVLIVPTNSPAEAARETITNQVAKAEPAPPTLSQAAKNAEGLGSPASNLLPMLPKMMTEYLKPNESADGGNGGGPYQPGDTIFVPPELNFVPPMPSQNRAIYRTR